MAIEPGSTAPAAPALDPITFGRLVEDELPSIYALIARRVGDRETAEELSGRVFTRALEVARHDQLDRGAIATLLVRIAASAAIDHCRRVRRSIPGWIRARDTDQPGDAEAAEELANEAAVRAFAAAIDRDRLRRALLDLDEQHRTVILLRYLDGLRPDLLAAALGVPPNEAAIRLHRALRALAGALEKSVDAA